MAVGFQRNLISVITSYQWIKSRRQKFLLIANTSLLLGALKNALFK